MIKTAMMILSSREVEHFWEVPTPWGYEKVLFYEGQVYLCTDVYKNLELAIAECQRDADAGFNTLILDQPEEASVWCCLPQSVQDKMLKNFIPTQPHFDLGDRPDHLANQLPGLISSEPESSNSIGGEAVKFGSNRSWLNLMMYFSQNPPNLRVNS